MRLICGLFQLDGTAASEERLRAMVAQMDVPRLRPTLNLWREGSVALAILDFSVHGGIAAGLPKQGASIIAADVRLDDPETLLQAVGAAPSVSESALLLAMLESYGPASLERVLGDFAFASWNRSNQRLTCGRDAFGIRPFAYVYQPGKLFAFASLPKALHGSGIVPKKIDEDAVARRMVLALRNDDCLVAGINRLPPAHFLEISREGIFLTPYWQLNRAAVGANHLSPTEAARELRRLVDTAVRCRLPRTTEIGAHLSGGLDSSAIAVLAARKLREEGRTLHAYSFLDRQRNDITFEDETDFVEEVVKQEGDINWTPIRQPAALFAPGSPMGADKMTWLHPDEPENRVCAHAEEQGVGVVLSGWGGDEGASFNGRGTFAELFFAGRWRTLVREVLALKRERGWSVSRILNNEIVSYLRPEGLTNFIRWSLGKDPDVRTLIRRSLSNSARRRLALLHADVVRMAPDGRENRWRLMTSPHISERAEVWAQAGARYGVAFAFPLLDRRVVEFSLSLPSELFLRDGFRRRPFRDAMADVLPEPVRMRHQKYNPFPGGMLHFAENKNEILAWIDTFEQNESVCRMIDLALLRRQVEGFPPPERLREETREGDNLTPNATMLVALQTLAVVEYLAQHGKLTPTQHT
jgi:asparagine synthase (glutamine-hydrolysing)